MLFLGAILGMTTRACSRTPEQEVKHHAKQLNEQAVVAYQHGKYQEAIALHQHALAIYEKALGPDHAFTAISLINLATLYQTLGQYEKALPLYQRALAINEKSLGSDHPNTVHILNNLAGLFKALGQYDKALPLYQHALEINERVLGHEHDVTAISLNNLAILYQTLGQYDKALPLYQRALAIDEKVLGSEHTETASIINNLAELYSILGQYDQALPLHQRALTIREKVLGPEHTETANSLINLAALYKTFGQYNKALPLYQRALAINEKSLGFDHANTAQSIDNLAGLYYIFGQYDKALPLSQRALAIREKALGPDHVDTATSLNNLAKIYEYTNHPDLALPLFQRSYRTTLSARVPDVQRGVQDNLGNFYATKGNFPTAIFYLKGAVNTMQSIRTESRGLDKSLQKSLLKKNEEIYNQLVDLLVEAGRLDEALQVLSMLKEEEYFDFIRRDAEADSRSTRMSYSSAEKPFAERLDNLGNAGAALVDQINALDKQAKLGLTPEQEKQRTRIKAQLAEQTKQTIALLNELPQQLRAVPKQQQERGSKENLAQLQATLASLGHGAVLLHYVVTDTRVRIILATPKVLLAREAEIPAKELYRKIIAFRQVQQNPALDPRPQAQDLYQLLIAPVANDLKQAHAQTLMLSLDGSLRYLPMAALYDGEAYLAERYPLAIYTEVAKDKLREKPVTQWKAAGLGITRKIGEFAPLPSVQQELDGIIHVGSLNTTGGVLPGDIYLDEAFTQTRLHDVLDRTYPVLHIASHFVFIPGTEAQSFLLLGDGKQLSLADIRTDGWKFNSVDLMTLSACETGLGGGRDANGREIEGFGTLVQRQGAKGVLATLWPVADQSTAILMQSLYRLRQEKHLTKAEALREAQLALISGNHKALKTSPAVKNAGSASAPAFTPDPAKPYAHPYYWAPFILMGNWL